uniref:ABC transporter ATP-binding protein n=1 Tax=Thermogemmatispora argillosa TaxID=2045280 RepID=A0A455T5V9_9CHLR|nr:ABC transporter ATP-binding protein [Thermogemmatispora argillosa]
MSAERQPGSREPAIEVEGLTKLYHRLLAVDHISFVTYRGEAFGFLGPNGAGKSTVVKILTGLVQPTEGTVRLLGRPLGDREVRHRIGYLPELPTFHRWLTAEEFLQFHGSLYGMSGSLLRARIEEVLALVGLAGRERQRLGTFSKGMLQRIGLAQALLNRPELLIIDELSTGLDPVGQHDLRSLLLDLKRAGTSIFINSHQLPDVEALCDRVAIINLGRILKVGAPEELFDEPLLVEVRAEPLSEALLQQFARLALSVERDPYDPCRVLLRLRREEQSAEVAAAVHACGARLYRLAPHRRSLEQVFLRTIELSRSLQ